LSARCVDAERPGVGNWSDKCRDDKDWSLPCYDFGGRIVWGLTAMILAEFGWHLARFPNLL